MNIGPGIHKDNLVFGFDSGHSTLGNGHDGFKRSRGNHGKPTTNTWNKNTHSYTNGNATATRNATPPVPPPPRARGYEVYKLQSNDGSLVQGIAWTSQVDQVNGGPYMHSVYCYLESGTIVTVGQHWNPWAYGSSQYPPLGRWVRLSEAVTNSANNYGNIANAYRTNGVAYFTATQYEPGTILTPFVGSSRSNTECIFDIANRSNTLSAASVSYNSNDVPTFDGTDDYISTEKTASELGIYNGAYTMEAVFKLDTTSGDNMVFGTNQLSTSQGLHLGVRNGVVYQGHYGVDRSAGSVSANTWYHAIWVHTGSQSIMYINGSAINSLASHGAFLGTTDIWIGRHWGYFDGDIAVAKIYNKAFGYNEVQRNFNSYKTRFGL